VPQASTTSQTFGRQVMETRRRKAWSQQRLSAELGSLGLSIHPTAITKVERGDRRVNIDEALLFAVALGVSPLHLLVPRDNEVEVRFTASAPTADAEAVRDWMKGTRPLWLVDDDDDESAHLADVFFFKEQPDEDWRVARSEVFRLAWYIQVVARAVALAEALGDPSGGPATDTLVDAVGDLAKVIHRMRDRQEEHDGER
jgi:transcriptional regulator with XRE-family HTH domain